MKSKILKITALCSILFSASLIPWFNKIDVNAVDASHLDKTYYTPTNIKSAGGWSSLKVNETENGTHISFKDSTYVTIRTSSSVSFKADGLHLSVENFEGDGLGIAFSNLQAPDAYDKALRFFPFNRQDYTGVMRYSVPTWSELAVYGVLDTKPIPSSFDMELYKNNDDSWTFKFNGQDFNITKEQFASAISDEEEVYVSFSAFGGSNTINTYSFDLTAIHDSTSKCATELTDEEIETLNTINTKILNIGKVDASDESKARIDEAEAAYNSIDEKMKKLVVNRNLLLYAKQNYYVLNHPLSFDQNNILTKMIVMSDNHIDTNDCTNYEDGSPQDRFEHGLEYASKLGVDTVVLAGDMTDWARFDTTSDLQTAKYQLNHFVESLNKSLADGINLFYCYGNHDSSTSSDNRSALFLEMVPEKYFDCDINKDDPMWLEGFRHAKIDGFDFINIEFDYTSENQAFSNAALDWMENKLEEITSDPNYDNKPIFVVQHCPFSNTAYGSSSRNETPSKLRLYQIYKKYPQIVMFAGHSHYPLNYQTYLYQSDFTTIVTAATGYLDMDGRDFLTEGGYLLSGGAYLVPYKHTTAQAVMVEVDKDYNMRITRLDVNKEKQILNQDIVAAPDLDEKTNLNYYTDARTYRYDAPEFKENTTLFVDAINDHTMRVSFDTVRSESIVQYYEITFTDNEGTHLFNTYSHNWMYPQESDMPLTKTVDIDSYCASKPYTVSVVAIDSYGNRSKPLTKVVVDTPEQDQENAQRVMDLIDSIGEITADSKPIIYSIKEEYDALSYDAKKYVTNYQDLKAALDEVDELYIGFEQYYYGVKTGKSMVGMNYWANTGEMALQNTDKGILITYSHAMANVRMGLKQFDLDGLHLVFDKLEKLPEMDSDEYPSIGILLGGLEHPIYTEPEKTSILLFLETSTGKLEGHPGFKQIIHSDALKYENLKNRQWDIKFSKLESGDFLIEVAGEKGIIDKSFFDGSFTLTDTSKAYLSISNWIEDGSFTLRLMSAHNENKQPCYPDEEISFAQLDSIKQLDKAIASIGTVTKNSKDAIESCETAYEQIPEKYRFLVNCYDDLLAARETYDNLDNQEQGDTSIEEPSQETSHEVSQDKSVEPGEQPSSSSENKKKGCKSSANASALAMLGLIILKHFLQNKKHK